jgi:hypothetical protein
MSTRNTTYDDLVKFAVYTSNLGIQIDQERLFNSFGLNYDEEKKKIAEEMKMHYTCSRCREAEDICQCYDRKYLGEFVGGTDQKVVVKIGNKNRVLEAMEKDKFVDGETVYSGTLNECSTDLTTIKQLAGVDWGKENSQSIGTVSEYWLNESVGYFTANNWEYHPIYLQLKENSTISCNINDKGKITGFVSIINREQHIKNMYFLLQNKNIKEFFSLILFK